ncbi:MAG: ImmA/IrrE family metallo-endopeptidase [Endomicrobium sp.]|jgi:Zn-dependent peptidase ImmA (M78 family)|nr:ImmA/IrrE family metallo-endopeptidase [Endomicrobium sp.]
MDRFREQIDTLYSNYNLSYTFPVPLLEIADKLGYDVFYFSVNQTNRHISGAVMYGKNGERGKILLNPEEAQARKNFTFAHEIGHIVLNHNDDGRIIDQRADIINPANGTREWQANEFAAELLMPKDEFKRQWDINKSIAALAEFFNTSIASTAIRIQKLGLEYGKR